jgi:LAO/AO transport system kinase
MDVAAVLAGVRAGERRAIARAISLVEARGAEGREVTRQLHSATGRALRIGITGSPGVGKSTLIAALIAHLRGMGKTVAVVSVDPTSPFTKGAVLGDRIRLVDHFVDSGVFIRSMASRGHLGGLSEATAGAVLVLDAAGFDVVLVETVGSGQNEVEVQALTETVALVLMPGSGDSIQAIKAGLMEIPDVLVINKADRPGADILRAELEATMSLVPAGPWQPPIVATQSNDGVGIAELWEAIERHHAFLVAGPELLRRQTARAKAELVELLRERMLRAAVERLAARVGALDELALRLARREVDPYGLADAVLA